jgi:hypothetical protein
MLRGENKYKWEDMINIPNPKTEPHASREHKQQTRKNKNLETPIHQHLLIQSIGLHSHS